MSASVKIGPVDKRCRYWAKVIREATALPLPSTVNGAADVPGAFSRLGDDELVGNDVLIQAEERHHRKSRGWSYCITFIGNDGEALTINPDAELKARFKAAGMDVELLKGAGDLAACIRIAHALRLAVMP